MRKTFILTIMAVIAVLFSGCDIPLITQFQAKRYLSKTESGYADTKAKFSDIKGYIFNSHGEDQQTSEMKATIDQNYETILGHSNDFTELRTYSFASNLSSGLGQYYDKVLDFAGDVQLMYKYFDLSEQTANDLIDTAEKIPTNLSGNHNALIKELTQEKQDYQAQKKEISDQSIPDYFYQARVSLITVLDAYTDYLNSVIRGLKTKNSQYLNVDQFMTQMDGGISRFTDQLIVIEKRGRFEERNQEIEDLQTGIEEEITDLKVEYKI